MSRRPAGAARPRRPFRPPGRPALLALLALAACAGGAAGPAAPAAAPASRRAAEAPPPAAVPPERALRLFDDAVAAEAELRKRAAPVDWELLGRKWQAVADAGDQPEAWFNLGVCLERQGRKGEAAAAWKRALERQPAFREAAANLALVSEPEDPRAALAHWEGFLRRFPDDALARARLASLQERAGHQDEALRLAREALLRDPRSLPAVKVMMRVALARKNLDLAHLLALRAQKLDPADPEMPTAIGRILLAQGDDAAAAAQWRRALQLEPGHAPARVELLRLELGKQHWAGVAEQARALLKADPTDARAQLALGVALRYLGEADQAAAAYDSAERLAGDRLPEVHLARGVLLARVREQCTPALAELRRYAVAAGPGAVADGGVGKLERECEQMLAAGRAAEEEARRMKAEQERKAPPPAGGPRKPGP
jgi:Flp pilus assembly protein TadD